MGNLVSYGGKLLVRTVDINTAKIHWNRIISNNKAKYMCLDIKNFYLMAALKYFEYMKIPLAFFSKLDSRTIRPRQTPKGWMGIPGNETSSMGITTGRDFGK
jgi:hypothetical protein